jgi:hypothetical protein
MVFFGPAARLSLESKHTRSMSRRICTPGTRAISSRPLLNSGFGYPNESIAINLGPANVRKEGAPRIPDYQRQRDLAGHNQLGYPLVQRPKDAWVYAGATTVREASLAAAN